MSAVDLRTQVQRPNTCLPCFLEKRRCGGRRPCIECLMRGCSLHCVDRESEQQDPAVLQTILETLRRQKRKSRGEYLEEESAVKKPKVDAGSVPRDDNSVHLLPDEVADAASGVIDTVLSSFYDPKNPFFEKSIESKTRMWRRFLTLLNLNLSKLQCFSIRDQAILDAVALCVDETGRAKLERLSSLTPYNISISGVTVQQQISVSEHEEKVLRQVFNICEVSRSDLALGRITLVFTAEDQCTYSNLMNIKLQRALGLSLETMQSDGTVQVDAPLKPSWHSSCMSRETFASLSKFMTVSLLHEFSQLLKVLEFVNATTKEEFSVLGLCLSTVSETEEDVSISWLFAIKPSSKIFIPHEYLEELD